jgi:calnexin
MLLFACLAVASAQFIERFETLDRWVKSEAKKDGVEEDLAKYSGQWELAQTVVEGDLALKLASEAAHSAITALINPPVDPKGKDLVVQYEVNPTKGLSCGGAYLKLFTYDKAFKPQEMTDKTPYTIMFGPDKCGGSDKLHFIFRHQNPKTKEFEEKHLMPHSPSTLLEDSTTLYTLVVRKDQSFEILVNDLSIKNGTLLKDFEPPVNPPKEIDDPEDKKPENWVDEDQIVDESAVKPEDWDEDAPREIPDEDAVKPEGWLEDAQANIPDPESTKPEDWDDEEDGEWVAPTVPNPACTVGCGPWKRPNKRNPAYKGKWNKPLIPNPAYKGPWSPKKIPNPNYYEDKTPSNFNKIVA